MLRQILIPICFILATSQMFAQVSVARWKLSEKQIFAGQPLIVELRVFFSEEPEGMPSNQIEISNFVDNQFRKLGFLIAVPNSVEEPLIERNGNVFSSLVWEGAVFHPDSGSFILGKALEMDMELSLDSGQNKQNIEVRFVPQAIRINDLPETVLPKAWSVGDFKMKYELNKKRYLTGEPIILTISFEGKGGLASIPPPQIPVKGKFLVYDPKSELSLEIKNDELIGSKDFTYEMAGAYQGDFNLGPISLYYFSPQNFRFDSVSIKQIPIKIVGKDIPQIVEVNALDNFYRDAFEKASPDQKIPFRFATILIWVATSILILLLLYGFIWELRKRS
ncbi:MAG: BatD family protein [Bacteroidia bacterium]|nr:BatD family protein [Bacteroidia bacterium]